MLVLFSVSTSLFCMSSFIFRAYYGSHNLLSRMFSTIKSLLNKVNTQ